MLTFSELNFICYRSLACSKAEWLRTVIFRQDGKVNSDEEYVYLAIFHTHLFLMFIYCR
jgi:hypothetical protein